MAEPPVVNASPLIVLARAGRLSLLRSLGDRVLVPAVVAAEVRAHSDEAATALAEVWLQEVPPVPVPETILTWDLGAGEAAVLSWALAHPGAVAVVDDYAARKCADALGVPVKGTLGLVLLAKSRGVVPLARPVVEELRRAGLYLSDDLLRRVLALIDE